MSLDCLLLGIDTERVIPLDTIIHVQTFRKTTFWAQKFTKRIVAPTT